MKSIFCGMETLSLVDYDGKIACTLFVGGCNFLCPFCHNSDLVLHPQSYPHLTDEEIFFYLSSRKKLLDAVVISGGEPTLYPQIEEYAQKIKEMGFMVKLDTNGTNPTLLKKMVEAGLVDFVAMDIKNAPDKYSLTTDVTPQMDKICESVEFLLSGKVDYEFRTTLVAEHHTTADIERIGEWIAGAKKYCLQHFDDKGANISSGLSAVPKDVALGWVNILQNKIKNVVLRGY